MKFLKLLFSRTILVALAILIELAFIVLSFRYFNNILTVQIISAILGFLAYLNLLNRQQSPELKMPWLVAFTIVPIFALVLYVTISNNRPSRKQRKMIAKINKKKIEYTSQSNNDTQQVEDYLTENCVIREYLINTTHMSGTLGNNLKYFDLGEKYFDSLLEDLRMAKNYIFLEYFIIDNGYMWNQIHEILVQKAKEGVEVRVLYDDIGTAGKIRSNFHKKLRKEGIQCYKFNPFVPVVSGIHNNRDHRKIAIIDGQVGYTGGINLADEYINRIHPFGHWKDTGIRIEGPAVKNLVLLFLEIYDISQNKFSDYDKYLNITYKEFENGGYVHPFGCGPTPYDVEQVGENNYINMIDSAQHSIYITTPYLIIDNNLTMALRNAALKGVDVRIITPHIPDKKIVFGMTRASYKYLMQAGVKIYEYSPGFIHSKQMLVDEKLAFIGTINLDYRSLVHHYECGAVVVDKDFANDMNKDFKQLFEVSEQQSFSNLKINKFTQFINSILAIFRPLF